MQVIRAVDWHEHTTFSITKKQWHAPCSKQKAKLYLFDHESAN
ncbi:hypothetical protein ALQ65_102318 [Pseudomonas syringae pv. coriandricola]|uniref:Uncharacterized protein n=1 Tax=Pseudomonas syringae pv. coriandricola TaxID=264453 RepID=A0A0P9N208_9PSED|nr:hypothetical protein ALO76_102473 [Pseudomonas syringae pv. coriandricola]RMN08740.1 hypothetical protein ALQ65_102318 [Pseudomonas syringae pv. coriandricola]